MLAKIRINSYEVAQTIRKMYYKRMTQIIKSWRTYRSLKGKAKLKGKIKIVYFKCVLL